MLSSELAKQIQLIELQARKILTGNLIGDYSTRLKGAGFEFDQVREYDPGDDVRFIDWKSSARTGRLLTKQYLDERNRTVMIMLDLSRSNQFADQKALMAQIAALLAAVANYGKDQVGLILFAGDVIKYVAPNKGAMHLMGLYQDIFQDQQVDFRNVVHDPKIYTQTSIKRALDFLARHAGRERMLLFVISDFIDQQDYSQQLKWAALQHDMIAIRCLDQQVQQLPEFGLIMLEDFESGEIYELDPSQYAKLNQLVQQRLSLQTQAFKQLGVDIIELESQTQFVLSVVKLFQQRMIY